MRIERSSTCKRTCGDQHPSTAARRGSVIVLSAAALVAVLAFVVFTVDLGFLLLTKTQMASAADAAVLAAGLELTDGLGLDGLGTGEEPASQSKLRGSCCSAPLAERGC